MKPIKQIRFALLLLMILTAIHASAHDFEVDGIYYNKTSSNTVAVTYRGTNYSSYDEYIGTVIIPSSIIVSGINYDVTSVAAGAFGECRNLIHLTLPNTVLKIEDYAFYRCSSLMSIVIPNSVSHIGNRVIDGCSRLHSITMGSGLLSVGTCSYLMEKVIWLANTPPSGYYNYYGKVNYVANNSYKFRDGKTIIYNNLSSIFESNGIMYVPVNPAERTCDIIDCTYSNAVKNITLNRTVLYRGISMTITNINPYSFYDNDFITTLKIDRDGNIPEYIFYGCDNIKTLEIPSTIINIGESAFSYCSSLTNITLSNTGNISEKAFYNSATGDAATLKINSSVTNVGKSAFNGCSSLTKIALLNTGSIGNAAFSGCYSIQSAEINNSGNIGDYAFQNNSSLKEINLCNRGTIGEYAFSDCSAAKSLTIAPTVTSIGDNAFSGCKLIADVIIENGEQKLELGSNGGSPLFAGCPLDEVYIGRKLSYPTASNYGYSPFYRNTSLRSVAISDAEIQIYDNEFYGCTNLQSVKIGDGVESFGKYAFSGCSKIDSFEFGSSVKTIGEEAFSDCTAMTNLYSRAIVPPTCGNQALDDINKWECTLHVLPEAEAAYKAANQWKDFFFVDGGWNSIDEIEADCGQSEFIVDGGQVMFSEPHTVTVYATDGRQVYSGETTAVSLDRGLYLMVVDGNSRHKIVVK